MEGLLAPEGVVEQGGAGGTTVGGTAPGQQSRIVFAMICLKKPNLLLLDEPVGDWLVIWVLG